MTSSHTKYWLIFWMRHEFEYYPHHHFFTLSFIDFTANLEPMDPANLNPEDDVTSMEIDESKSNMWSNSRLDT